MHLSHFTIGTTANVMPRQLQIFITANTREFEFFFYFSKSTVGITYYMHIYTFFSENASWATGCLLRWACWDHLEQPGTWQHVILQLERNLDEPR